MSHAYSLDLRERVVAYVQAGGDRKQACQIFQIGRDTLYRWLLQVQTEGSLAPRRGGKDAPENWMMSWWPSKSQSIPMRRWQNWGRSLLSAPWPFGKPAAGCRSPEKKTLLSVEWDKVARAQFQDELADLDPDDLVYLDESGVDEALHRPYARAARGTTVRGDIAGSTTQRISLIAALNRSELVAPMRFEGYGDTEVFKTWLEQALWPELRPGQTVLMDHASFHKSAATKALIETKDCHLKYLPPYSPDLNPIESQWAILKARLRKHHQPHQALGKAIDTIFTMY